MGDFPSGQRGQTVNLLSLTSVVRIHHPPPEKSKSQDLLFSYPSRRLGISSPREVRCISSAPLGLYLITRQRASCLRLDDIQHFVLMICNSYGIDDIHAFGVIEARGCEKLLYYLTKYDIILSKGVIVWIKTIY